MNGEVLFRKAAFGGFNRDDVLEYVNSVASDSSELKELQESTKKLTDELEALKAQLTTKNSEITSLKNKIEALESELKSTAEIKEAQNKASETETTADNLMRDSIAYAERYVESASVMARNIRSDTAQKIDEADRKVSDMLKKIEGLADDASSFEQTLLSFKSEFKKIIGDLKNE